MLPVQLDLPRIASGGMQTGHDLYQRRFSRTVLAEKRGDFVGVDGDGNVVER